ncbi:MAG: long-chain-acyl-CoA synthetase [Deltaproteobacteria bacterium]|nr:MAG: long-chain-acyl-CoA synthetase [Deltaproteobacteria bacterium]
MAGPRRFFAALGETLRDVIVRLGNPDHQELLRIGIGLVPAAMTQVLPWFWRTREGHDESLMRIVLQNAADDPDGLAVEMGHEQLSWSELDRQTSAIAHVLASLGVQPGDVVALVGLNSPRYLATTLAITRVGAVAALINHHLEGGPLAHAVRTSAARVAIVEASLAPRIATRPELEGQLDHLVTYRTGELEDRLDRAPTDPFPRVPTDVSSDFVYIYTSGTTGLPKPCRVSHGRTLLAAMAFGHVLFEFQPGDKLYSVLPLYHSNAMLIAAGSCIMTRTPIALRESFSATAFWTDVRAYRATAMIYIGELCRYLVNTDVHEAERENTLRIAVGNGLRADVWEPFAERFGIPKIREFYSATEAPGILMNLTGKVGSIGFLPGRRLSSLKLARYDVDAGELLRGADGYCIECGPDEVGQLMIALRDKPLSALGDFKGYTDASATESKQAHSVFEADDRYFMSGDLMRFDDDDFVYFVDRIGDTYRWKGENVSTEEVAEVLGTAPGVQAATVASIHVPGREGQAGLAGIVCGGAFDADAFWQAAQELPSYAQPRFLRLVDKLETTGTLKIQKHQLRAQGVDPSQVTDPLYLRTNDGYVPLTAELYGAVTTGAMRL